MAALLPFKGLLYDPERVKLAEVLDPSEAARGHSAAFLHLLDPESDRDDRSKYIRYARSAARLHQLRREGVLRPDAEPAFYLWERSGRHWLFAKVRLAEFTATGATPASREEKLRLLEATRAYLSPIPLSSDLSLSAEAMASATPIAEVDGGALRRVSATLIPTEAELAPEAIEPLLDAALAFRRSDDPLREKPEDFGLARIAVSVRDNTQSDRNTYTGDRLAGPELRLAGNEPLAGLVSWCLSDV